MSCNRATALLRRSMLTAAVIASPTLWAATLVSGPSPFAGCTVGGAGTNYVNAEVEPYVAVNPANPTNYIGVWQQDRWSNGGAHGLMSAASFDGGATWKPVPQPFSACAGGLGYERASDPWVSFGPDGTAYSVSISFNHTNNSNAVGAAVSRDGGLSWTLLTKLITDDEPSTQFFNDKESVTADPVKRGVAYAVWDRLEQPNGNPYADQHALAFRGPGMFSKTVDGGQTWSAPSVMVNTPSEYQTIGNQIVVNAQTGALYDFFNYIHAPGRSAGSNSVAFVQSTDGGATWSKPQIIASLQLVSVTDPNTGEALRTGDIIPEPAIDPATGQLYVVWQDGRFSGGAHADIALSTSTDGGRTWSAPSQVNTPTGKAAFNAMVGVNSAGTVAVTYYDVRNLAAGNTTTLPTDYWQTLSTNGGQSFGSESHLAGPFDMKTAPVAEGFFIGDYAGLAATGTKFVPFFIQTNSGNLTNRTDVFASP